MLSLRQTITITGAEIKLDPAHPAQTAWLEVETDTGHKWRRIGFARHDIYGELQPGSWPPPVPDSLAVGTQHEVFSIVSFWIRDLVVVADSGLRAWLIARFGVDAKNRVATHGEIEIQYSRMPTEEELRDIRGAAWMLGDLPMNQREVLNDTIDILTKQGYQAWTDAVFNATAVLTERIEQK